MHLGTMILTSMFAVGVALLVHSYYEHVKWGDRASYDRPDTGFVMFLAGMSLVLLSGVFLGVVALNHQSCLKSGADYSVATDFSWLNGCRTPANVDGNIVLVPFNDFRFFNDLQLEREGA